MRRRLTVTMMAMAWLAVRVEAQAAMLVDDFEDGNAINALGGQWQIVTDGTSTASAAAAEGHESSGGYGIDYLLKPGVQYPYAMLVTYLRPDAAPTGVDLSAQVGVRFWARGKGALMLQVATSKTAVEYNHWNASVTLTSDWRRFEIAFDGLVAANWGSAQPWDPTTVYALQWLPEGAAGASGEIFLDGVEFYGPGEASGPEPATVYPTPKVNQVGYLPDARKLFVIVAGSAQPGDAFQVEEAAHGGPVLTGSIAGPAIDDRLSSGETVLFGDFSTLTATGRYRVVVNGKSSPPFEVGERVYQRLFRDALRAFHLIRCGVAIDDPETGLKHDACHLDDASWKGEPTGLDVTGGWHNAGDFGKWVPTTAISAAKLMWAWELNPRGVAEVSVETADSSNDVPDILDQARWGIEWLLKMQRNDGSVFHKVDSEPNFAWGLAPENDPYPRVAADASTLDAAVAAAALAQAARVFGQIDPEFAERCRMAAERAFAWMEANPAVAHTDPYYADSDPSQEITWAVGELSRLRDDAGLRARFAAVVAGAPAEAVTWQRPQLLGYLAVATDTRADAALRKAVVGAIDELARGLAATTAATGYRVSTTPDQYAWGSNENLLDRAGALMSAALLVGNDEYRRLALEQLDWLLGKNPLDLCFVTGHGTRTVEHPYHWVSYALHVLMPGWASGGPNQYPDGADAPLRALQATSAPPAKCFLDLASTAGSWASNEGQITENAALVLLTGLTLPGPTEARSGEGCSCVVGGRGEPAAAVVLLALLALLRRRSR